MKATLVSMAAAALLVASLTACAAGGAASSPRQEVLGAPPPSPTSRAMANDSSMDKSGAMNSNGTSGAMANETPMQGGAAMAEPTKTGDSMTSGDVRKQVTSSEAMSSDNAKETGGSMTPGKSTASGAAMPQDNAMGGTSMQQSGAMQGDGMMKPEERYVDYSPEALANAIQRGRAVLFFERMTGSSSSADDKSIKSNLGLIPGDVTVLKVADGDAMQSKDRYHVMGDPTFVQVDASGHNVGEWMGSGVQDLLAGLH